MQLALTDDQQMLVDTFSRFFEEESSSARVRAGEAAGGHDPELWTQLGQMGVFAMRLPGEEGFSLFDTALVMEQAGKRLASGPIIENLIAVRLLATLAPDSEWLGKAAAGEAVVTMAPFDVIEGKTHLVPGGAVADAVLFLVDDEVRCIESAKSSAPANHAGHPLAPMILSGDAALPSRVIASGEGARTAYLAAVEEWKLLTAAMLNGLSRQAIMIAAEYARERQQFGRPIGSFQAVAHPLADRIIDIEAANMLLWGALKKVADGDADAAGEVGCAYWWSARSSSDAVQRALHTLGGYGLTIEYDPQLYHRRAKGLVLVAGDPADELVKAGARLWTGLPASLPDAGPVHVEFGFGEEAEAFADETREFFESWLTPEWHANSHYSYDGHDWELNQAMGEKGLLFPSWPREIGGRGGDDYMATAGLREWVAKDVTFHAQSVSNMVGIVINAYGSDKLKEAVLPELAAGRIISCLGYSEPSSGSDVFAAKTRAVRDGDDWVINGQKMFTSGSNLADHVLLLTRTDPDAPKHAGVTLFVVPLNDPGIEIHPVHTYQEERTNATFYSDVRVPDWRRIGEIHGGTEVLGWALSLEQGGFGFYGHHRRVVDAAIDWARTSGPDGAQPIRDPRVLERLARAYTHARASELVFYRSMWIKEQGIKDRAAGPMSKVISSELFLRDTTDLLDLCAPDTLLHGRNGLGEIELHSRHASATTIYAGTSEVHRSQVAEKALGLPRSR